MNRMNLISSRTVGKSNFELRNETDKIVCVIWNPPITIEQSRMQEASIPACLQMELLKTQTHTSKTTWEKYLRQSPLSKYRTSSTSLSISLRNMLERVELTEK